MKKWLYIALFLMMLGQVFIYSPAIFAQDNNKYAKAENMSTFNQRDSYHNKNSDKYRNIAKMDSSQKGNGVSPRSWSVMSLALTFLSLTATLSTILYFSKEEVEYDFRSELLQLVTIFAGSLSLFIFLINNNMGSRAILFNGSVMPLGIITMLQILFLAIVTWDTNKKRA